MSQQVATDAEYSRRQIWEAESVIAILGKLDPERLPLAEGRAVGECQARAVESWLAAYLDLSETAVRRRGAIEPLRRN